MTKKTLTLILIFVAVAIIYTYAHVALGFVCPLPWPDESHFVWPAISLAEHGTFVSPELNPDRAIYWMPPGYMTILGGIFAVTEPSLAVARWFSFACVLGAFAFFLFILQRLKFSWLSITLAAAFWLNASFVACGNVARMEALVLLLVMATFWLLIDGRLWLSIGILALTPLVHPNGLYFLVAGIAFAVFQWRSSDEKPRMTFVAKALFGLVVVLWGLFLWQCISNWTNVSTDLAFQFTRKGERSFLNQVLDWDNLALLIMLIGWTLVRGWRDRTKLPLLGIALAGWLADMVGFEMWYRVYWMLAALIIAMLFFDSAWAFILTRLSQVKSWARYALMTALVLTVVLWHYGRENLESPISYPYEMQFFEMSVPDGVTYLTDADRANVKAIIAAESANRPITVQFFPRAEALFYLDMRSPVVQLSDPLFYNRKPDLCIFHESKYMPPRWTWFLGNDMRSVGLEPKNRARYVVFEREDHERWYGFKP